MGRACGPSTKVKSVKFKEKSGTFLLRKFVGIEIVKNVQQQKSACARPPEVTKLCKARLGHFFVDISWFHIFVEIVDNVETNFQSQYRLIIANTKSGASRRHHM